MSTMEGELEILLGELHIKMKGANTHTHAHTCFLQSPEQFTGYQWHTISQTSNVCFHLQVSSASLDFVQETSTRLDFLFKNQEFSAFACK